MGDFRFRAAAPGDHPAIRAVVCAVLAEYGLALDPADTDADLQDVISSYAGRGGSFRVLVSPAGEIVGCGGLYPLDERQAEIRKMYLLPEARGRGLGRRLLQELVEEARAGGFERVVLETASVLKEAISLYRSFGFVPLERAHLASRCDQAYVLALSGEAGA
jgi:putative acetyltransferase